jgi:apolipoprotein N-acyltransferase
MKLGIDISRQGNFIMAVLLIHFVFFGYICNVFEKAIEEELVFLYKVLFSPATFLSLIILIGIVFFMVFRENFYEYGIRNSIWLVPIIIVMSWIWYWFLNGFDITLIGVYFTTAEAYITILSLLGINLFTAILAAYAKERYKKYLEKIKKVV